MPLIALLLFTAGASAQTETAVPAPASAYPPGAVVQPIPRSTEPSTWQQAQSRIDVARDPSISGMIYHSRPLHQVDGPVASAYMRFILANTGWTGDDRPVRIS